MKLVDGMTVCNLCGLEASWQVTFSYGATIGLCDQCATAYELGMGHPNDPLESVEDPEDLEETE
jgi:hypothetical protein